MLGREPWHIQHGQWPSNANICKKNRGKQSRIRNKLWQHSLINKLSTFLSSLIFSSCRAVTSLRNLLDDNFRFWICFPQRSSYRSLQKRSSYKWLSANAYSMLGIDQLSTVASGLIRSRFTSVVALVPASGAIWIQARRWLQWMPSPVVLEVHGQLNVALECQVNLSGSKKTRKTMMLEKKTQTEKQI